MMNSQDEIIKSCRNYLKEINCSNYSISYILCKKEHYDIKEIKAVAHDESNYEDIISIQLTDDEKNNFSVADWDFNVETYLLEDLEHGYEFVFAPLNEHYNIWCQIDEWRDDIEHQDGLQLYLGACQRQGITKEAIALLGYQKVDITDLYQEQNNRYKIIADISCGDKAIVLAYNENAPSQYVTWRTTPNRKRGFDSGYYCSSFKDAYENFEKRCMDMMEDQVAIQKNKCRPNKIKKDPER